MNTKVSAAARVTAPDPKRTQDQASMAKPKMPQKPLDTR